MFCNNYKISNQNENPGVYTIPSDDCSQVYIKRSNGILSKRVNEHKYAVRTDHYSALTNHFHSGHSISFNKAKIVHSECNVRKRLITEAILLRINNTFLDN